MPSSTTFHNANASNNNNNHHNTNNNKNKSNSKRSKQSNCEPQQQQHQMTTIPTAAVVVANTNITTTTTTAAATTSTPTKEKFPTKTSKQKIIKSSSFDNEILTQHQHQHHQQHYHQHHYYPQLQQQQPQQQQPPQQQLHSRKITIADWKRYNTIHGGSITRTGSTSSLASAATTTTAAALASANYQELKMEIINQGKCLCGQYIRSRLRRAGVLNRKAIQRLRTILESSPTTTTSDVVIYEVFPALNSMGEELERMHPRIYSNVSRQLSRTPFGELQDGDTAPMLLSLVAKDLFRHSITWGKIISIFAVCGGFAIDCVRQGHYDYLQYLVEGLTEIIEDDLVYWLAENGGWRGLQQHIRRPRDANFSFLGMLAMFVAVSSGVYVISNFVKHLGCHLYSLLF